MLRPFVLILATFPLAAPLAAQAEAPRPQALQALLSYHETACAAQAGTLAVPAETIVEMRLNGDDTPDLLLDSRKLSCSTAPSMFCGEGVGCELNVFVGEAQHSLVVLDWSIVEEGGRQALQVTISGELLNKPEAQTFRATWDDATNALTMRD